MAKLLMRAIAAHAPGTIVIASVLGKLYSRTRLRCGLPVILRRQAAKEGIAVVGEKIKSVAKAARGATT
jgi:hypothetical protein